MEATPKSSLLPHVVAFLAGLVICLVIAIVGGRREPWDTPLYFIAGIPLMCAVAVALGYAYPVRAWRWALGIALGQSVALAFSGGSLALWPMALVAMTIASMPQLVAAFIGSALAKRRAR